MVSAAGVTGWHLDETNTGTGPTMLDEFGGVVQFEADTAQGDGYHYQLANNTTVFEPVKLIAGRRAWFSTCFSLEDADQSLFFIGCHIAADDPLGTEPSDQFGVRSKPSTLGTMQFCAGKTNSTEVTADIKLGSLLGEIGREAGGVDLDIERDKTPTEPVSFE